MGVPTVRVVRSVALGLVLVTASVVRAAERPAPLHYDLALDASLTGGMALTALLLTVFQSDLAPATCRWCTPGGLDDSVRNALVWDKDFRTANVLSSVGVGVIMPLSALGYLVLSANSRGDVGEGFVDSLLVAEAMSAALVLNQAVKLLVGRQRPYAYYGHDLGITPPDSDKNSSFYGGHSSFAFSMVAATVTLASMRGYSGTGAVAAVGFALAGGVGYLRIAADQHYLTDILVGAAVGGLVGWAIPHLFHSRKEPGQPGALQLAPGGLAIAF